MPSSQSHASSPSLTSTLVEDDRRSLPSLWKYTLLSCLCLAQYLDAFNISAMFSVMPTLEAKLGISADESSWLICAFQCTFASFLLMSGKLSDVYNSKYAFIAGIGGLGALSLASGLSNEKIVLLVLRAIAGIFGSLTVPAALKLIVHIFYEPKEQARAIGLFGGFAAFGNVSGLIISALFVQYTSWRWVFWFMAVVCMIIVTFTSILAPRPAHEEKGANTNFRSNLSRLDIPGVSMLTAGILLLIFALTFAPSQGWGSAIVLTPLIISLLLIAAFFLWENHVPTEHAAIPPRVWFYPNFAVLFGAALLPFFWWTNVFVIFTTLWQEVYHWSVISTAAHMLPIGISAFALSFTGSLTRVIRPKYLILCGQVLMGVSTIMLTLADRQGRYWAVTFPAFVIGSSGAQLAFTHTNIAIFRSAPSSMTGTVGAMFNAALQVGSAVGIAAAGSIQNAVNGPSDVGGFEGRRAALWFSFAVVVVEGAAVLLWFKVGEERVMTEPEGETLGCESQGGRKGGSAEVIR